MRAPVLALLLAASCTFGCPSARENGGPERPNVVLIVLDTVRADMLSAYGYSKPTTPNLERIAREGTRFERAFATDFWTLPSHASLLTGLYPSEHHANSETLRLTGDASTLAENLSEVGFRTAAWVGNPWLSIRHGFGQGFQHYMEMWHHPASHPGDFSADRQAVREASSWIAQRATGDAPFFLFMNLNTAHLPYSPTPAALLDLTPEFRPIDRTARLKKVTGTWQHLTGNLDLDDLDYQILKELYEAELLMVDGLVGSVIAALETAGVLDETLLIITSDHGENIGDHGMIDHMLSMFETTIRIPLIVRHPAHFPPGHVNTDLVSQVDVFPTVLEIAQVEPAVSLPHARSLVGSPRESEVFVIAENERPLNGIEVLRNAYPDFDATRIDRRIRMLRTASHKLVWHEDQNVELYDLERDPGEQHDIARENEGLRDELLGRLEAWMAAHETHSKPPAFGSPDPDAIEALRALGYIE